MKQKSKIFLDIFLKTQTHPVKYHELDLSDRSRSQLENTFFTNLKAPTALNMIGLCLL